MSVVFFMVLNIVFLSSNNILFLWGALFFITLSYVFSISGQLPSLKFFVIQEVASVNIMFSFALKMPMVLILIVLLKMAIPPFHSWFFSIIPMISMGHFVFFITFMKLIPFVILYMVIHFISFILILLGFAYTFYMFMMMSNVPGLLFMSSGLSSYYFIILLKIKVSLFFMLFMFYSVFLFVFSSSSLMMPKNVEPLLFVVLFGLPTLVMFFLKWLISLYFWKMSILFSMVLFTLIGISLLLYLKMLFFYFFTTWFKANQFFFISFTPFFVSFFLFL